MSSGASFASLALDQFKPWQLLTLTTLGSVVTGAVLLVTVVYWVWRSTVEALPELPSFQVPTLCEPVKPTDNGADSVRPTLQTAGPEKIYCFDPATGVTLGTVPITPPEEVQAAVDRARQAQQQWCTTTLAERQRLLRALLQFVVDNQAVICRVSARDTGKTFLDAHLGEILTTCEKLTWTIRYGAQALRPSHRETSWMLSYKHAIVEYCPVGVQGAIVSWNYPFHNMLGPIITALFVGNGIVIKASEHVAWSAQLFISQVRQIVARLGYDPEIVQLVLGYKEIGEALVRSNVDHLTFIGSTEVGKMVMANAASNLTPCVLELGGKDCLILRHDCLLDRVLPIAMRGVFQNSGQNCVGIERVIAHRAIYQPFVQAIVSKVKELTQGAPLDEPGVDIGAMTMGNAHIQKLESLLAEAVAHGAQIHTGGERFHHPRFPSGTFFKPTVISGVTPSMRISQEEHFGPLVVIMGPYDTDEELLAVANQCPHGLGSSIFTQDTNRGYEMALKLYTGMCNVNDFGANYLCQSLPFGGVKASGIGRFAGYEGIRGVCALKTITVDRFPRLIFTAIPRVLQYPTLDSHTVGQFSQELAHLFYNGALASKAVAAATLARLGLQTPS
ncbi:Meiotic Sister-Chromatid recombination aldehyde dehydrogenase [Dispira parvispora]|uniref:Meiotic Sister-Chromatid recombination aldehyde dehydrogenase n=1 Tax=Dispira parvispora TaxID=1520584 RepID=A0A9W8AP08_9FUNG|nr:Meiotic Sister-Chromatid recombination aldehyde dehydrogenase [Dispira parvispora]